MPSIIISFPKIEEGNQLKKLLNKFGYEVAAVCNNGRQTIGIANELDGGILLCGYRLSDMHYSELYQYLPKEFHMLLITSPTKLADIMQEGIVCLSMPIKSQDLMNTIRMMTYSYQKQRKREKKVERRSAEEKKLIVKAKTLLMDRNKMTEEEAHRYIQKMSMDSGTNMAEMAGMILDSW